MVLKVWSLDQQPSWWFGYIFNFENPGLINSSKFCFCNKIVRTAFFFFFNSSVTHKYDLIVIALELGNLIFKSPQVIPMADMVENHRPRADLCVLHNWSCKSVRQPLVQGLYRRSIILRSDLFFFSIFLWHFLI